MLVGGVCRGDVHPYQGIRQLAVGCWKPFQAESVGTVGVGGVEGIAGRFTVVEGDCRLLGGGHGGELTGHDLQPAQDGVRDHTLYRETTTI